MFQALIEFNLSCPPALHRLSADMRVAAFETYWDNELPRFGDVASTDKSWRKWYEDEHGEKKSRWTPDTHPELTDAQKKRQVALEEAYHRATDALPSLPENVTQKTFFLGETYFREDPPVASTSEEGQSLAMEPSDIANENEIPRGGDITATDRIILRAERSHRPHASDFFTFGG